MLWWKFANYPNLQNNLFYSSKLVLIILVKIFPFILVFIVKLCIIYSYYFVKINYTLIIGHINVFKGTNYRAKKLTTRRNIAMQKVSSTLTFATWNYFLSGIVFQLQGMVSGLFSVKHLPPSNQILSSYDNKCNVMTFS